MNIGDSLDVLHGPRTDFSTSGDNNDVPGSDFYGAPYFGQTNTEVLVQEGNHAFFHCPVHNIRNQTVRKNRRLLIYLPSYKLRRIIFTITIYYH